jgi:chloramphenicol-sensitive protein RarD
VGSWGLIPLYFKAVAGVAPLEVLAHRALWSFVMLAILVGLRKRWGELWREPMGLTAFGTLMLSGPVTAVPLLFFGGAARRLRLSTLGILQYLSPTLQFLLAVAVFREPFAGAQIVSFACVWMAILIYAVDSLRAAQPSVALVEPD